jgi:AraC-like DNA-binding protein
MAFSTLVLRSFLESVERLRLSRDDLLAGLIADSALDSDSAWIEESVFGEILCRALKLSDDPALGLRIGEQGNFAAFGAAGLLFGILPNFRDAVSAMAQFHAVARDRPDISVRAEEQALVVSYDPFESIGAARRCLAEIVLGSVSALLRQYGGAQGVAGRVQFEHAAPAYAAEYRRVFGCEVQFEQPRTALSVDRELAERRQLLNHPELASELRKRAEARHVNGGQPRTLIGKVRAEVRERWRSGAPTMEAVASALGMSQRSLHRHLAREGLDYRSILNEARCEAAAELLRQDRSSVKQVAHELGFASSSAFYRAFKRWMGCSPSDYAAGNIPADGPRPGE